MEHCKAIHRNSHRMASYTSHCFFDISCWLRTYLAPCLTVDKCWFRLLAADHSNLSLFSPSLKPAKIETNVFLRMDVNLTIKPKTTIKTVKHWSIFVVSKFFLSHWIGVHNIKMLKTFTDNTIYNTVLRQLKLVPSSGIKTKCTKTALAALNLL